jgi:hypothetical protein
LGVWEEGVLVKIFMDNQEIEIKEFSEKSF